MDAGCPPSCPVLLLFDEIKHDDYCICADHGFPGAIRYLRVGYLHCMMDFLGEPSTNVVRYRGTALLANTILKDCDCAMLRRSRGLTATSMMFLSERGFKKGRGTGDQGQSSLFSNERRWKDDTVFEALGTLDELNSLIGMCRAQCQGDGLVDVAQRLERVQCCLQDLASHVATPPAAKQHLREKTSFDNAFVTFVNEAIDFYGDRLPPLRVFILPGGGATAALLQYARSTCRRAERRLIPLMRTEAIDANAFRFINRLSDLLFVMGRHACSVTGNRELTYFRQKN